MKNSLLLIVLVFIVFGSNAQDLEELVNEETEVKDEVLSPAYKSDRIINSINNEFIGERELDFKIDHHFGDMGGSLGGSQSFWGLDEAADIKIGFIYGINDNWNIGIARYKGYGQQRQLLEASVKTAILKQTTLKVPISLSFYGTLVAATNKSFNNPLFTNNYETAADRFSINAQLVITRKFGSKLSMTLLPTFVRNNQWTNNTALNTFGLGFAGRYKISKRWGFLWDYYYSQTSSDVQNMSIQNPLGLGVEIETGGHVFHLAFTNNRPLSETQFIPNTQASWTEGEVRWGFRISRIFNL